MNSENIKTLSENLHNTISHYYPNFDSSWSMFPTNDNDLSAPKERISVKEVYNKIMNDDFNLNNGLRIDNLNIYGVLVMNFLLSHKDENLNLAKKIFKTYLYECSLK